MRITAESLKGYRKYLEGLASSHSPELFANGGKEHATILYDILLKHSNRMVRIFCEEGVSEIWQDESVQHALREFASKPGTTLQILVENQGDDGFAGVRMMENVTVRHATQEDISKVHSHFDNDNCNFAVFDDDKFRYEYDKRNYKAYGSFNDEEVSGTMIQLFDALWTSHEQN